MSGTSSIEWTDKSWNPVRGCSIVSPGCTNCYAMKFAHRFSGTGQAYEGLTMMTKGGPVWTGKMRLIQDDLVEPITWVKPSRVFVNSMSDLFHEDLPFQYIADVFAVMACTTRHTYQVLTKRPARMLEFFNWLNLTAPFQWPEQVQPTKVWPQWTPLRGKRGGYDNCGPRWPLKNVWLGVSVEDQARADERIPLLLKTPAAVRWISAEPLLGPVSLLDGYVGKWPTACKVDDKGWCQKCQLEPFNGLCDQDVERLDWVVAGGESGPGARPSHPDWFRKLRDECKLAGVPFFFKQWGGHLPGELKRGEPTIRWQDGRTEWYGDHADIKYQNHWLTNDEAGLVIAWPTAKKAAGRKLDGRTHDKYPR